MKPSIFHSLVWVIPLCLFAQASQAPITGLKVLSTTIDPKTYNVTVQVQNTTDRVVVGYAVFYLGFDKDGKQIGKGTGMLADYNGPDNLSRTGFILPGQIAAIRGYGVGPDTVSVEAKVVAVIYEDDSREGAQAPLKALFTTRRTQARQAREQAAKESGSRQLELERKAEWWEAHSPKEAAQ